MKNIHILPTDKPSRLFYNVGGALLFTNYENHNGVNIYITNSEEIKEGVDQWYLDKFLNKPRNSSGSQYGEKQDVIILTTDQDLIKDGVQAIDYDFLEWFVKNPSCEDVDIKKGYKNPNSKSFLSEVYTNKEINSSTLDYLKLIENEETILTSIVDKMLVDVNSDYSDINKIIEDNFWDLI